MSQIIRLFIQFILLMTIAAPNLYGQSFSDGVWQTAWENEINAYYHRFTVTVADDQFIWKTEVVHDHPTAGMYSSIVEWVYHVDRMEFDQNRQIWIWFITLDQLLLTPTNYALAGHLNNIFECGISDWIINQARDIRGRKCAFVPNAETVPSIFSAVQVVVALDGNQTIQMGPGAVSLDLWHPTLIDQLMPSAASRLYHRLSP